jgi:hypothetical protein
VLRIYLADRRAEGKMVMPDPVKKVVLAYSGGLDVAVAFIERRLGR